MGYTTTDELKGGKDSRRVAQMLTAALKATCLQLRPPLPANAASMLGQAGLAAPTAAAAALARMVGRYKLNAVQDMYVREPERS